MQLDKYKYQWEVNSENIEPKNNLRDWVSNYGANVIERNDDVKWILYRFRCSDSKATLATYISR